MLIADGDQRSRGDLRSWPPHAGIPGPAARTSTARLPARTDEPVPPGAHHATPFQPDGSSKPYLRARGFFNLSTWIIAIAGAAILLLAYHLIISRSVGRSRSGRSRRWAHR